MDKPCRTPACTSSRASLDFGCVGGGLATNDSMDCVSTSVIVPGASGQHPRAVMLDIQQNIGLFDIAETARCEHFRPMRPSTDRAISHQNALKMRSARLRRCNQWPGNIEILFLAWVLLLWGDTSRPAGLL